MGVVCQILINQPSEGKHQAGTLLTGVVKYAVNKKTEFRDVTLTLFGKAKSNWREGSNSTTYIGWQNVITRVVNVTNKAPEEMVTLHGIYEYPFEFYLPENLPTTYKDKNAKVTYSIEMEFVKPSILNKNIVVTEEFAVHGCVDPIPILEEEVQYVGPVIFGVQKKLFAPFTKNKPVVKLKGKIANNCLVPGEDIQLSFVVSNQTDALVDFVRAELFCYTTYSCSKGTKETAVKIIGCTGTTGGVSERSESTLTCVVPTLPELFSLQNCEVVMNEYRVRVTLVMPAPRCDNDAIVEIPIVIGVLTQAESVMAI